MIVRNITQDTPETPRVEWLCSHRELRVAAKSVSQSAHTQTVQRHGCNRLGAVHIATTLREPEHVVGKQKRHHPALSAGEIAKRLDDSVGDDKDGLRVRAFPVNKLSTWELKGRRDAGDLRTLA